MPDHIDLGERAKFFRDNFHYFTNDCNHGKSGDCTICEKGGLVPNLEAFRTKNLDKFDKILFPDEKKYLQEMRLASITASLDRVASELERSGYLKLAYEIDKISDSLENKM